MCKINCVNAHHLSPINEPNTEERAEEDYSIYELKSASRAASFIQEPMYVEEDGAPVML